MSKNSCKLRFPSVPIMVAAPVTLLTVTMPTSSLAELVINFNAQSNTPVSASSVTSQNSNYLDSGTSVSAAVEAFNVWLQMLLLQELRTNTSGTYEAVRFDDCDGSCYCDSSCLKQWYLDKDNDGYHGDTQEAADSPGAGWKEGASKGEDCDDNDDTKTTNCCPKGQIPNGSGGCKFDPCSNKDLRHKKVADNIKNMLSQRTQQLRHGGQTFSTPSFRIQTIEGGLGDINLDRYTLDITELPPGFSANDLFNYIRSNFEDFAVGAATGSSLDFLNPGTVKFGPYSDLDNAIWNSNNPVGAAMDFNTLLDTATVVLTEFSSDEMFWIFTTVNSIDHLGHPVSGHRKFQLETNSDVECLL